MMFPSEAGVYLNLFAFSVIPEDNYMISDSGEKRVQIALKALPTAVQRALPPSLPTIVQSEYASRFSVSFTCLSISNLVLLTGTARVSV